MTTNGAAVNLQTYLFNYSQFYTVKPVLMAPEQNSSMF